jgi:Flp pilus assembly pilin Flp
MDTDPTPGPDGPVTDDRGASLVEYALLMALIAVVCISAITFFGSSDAGSFTDSANSIVGAG